MSNLLPAPTGTDYWCQVCQQRLAAGDVLDIGVAVGKHGVSPLYGHITADGAKHGDVLPLQWWQQ